MPRPATGTDNHSVCLKGFRCAIVLADGHPRYPPIISHQMFGFRVVAELHTLRFAGLGQFTGEQMTITGAICVIAKGAVERAIPDHAGLCFANLFGSEQSGGDTQFVEQPLGFAVVFQGFRGAGEVKQALVAAVERQIKLLFKGQEAFTAMNAKAHHGPLVQAKQARRPGVAQRCEHKPQGFHGWRHRHFQRAVLLE